LHHPVTLMDRARPPPHGGGAQTIETNISEVTLVNLIPATASQNPLSAAR
jgi:hypothetical protein